VARRVSGQVTNKSKYLIAFLLFLIAAGIWRLRDSDVGQPRADKRGAQSADQVSAAINKQANPPVEESEEARPSDTADRSVAGKTGAETAAQLNAVPSSIQSSAGNSSSNPNPTAPTSNLDGLSVPEGAPFPVSEAIEVECAYHERLKIGCADVREILNKIEKEKTDNQWAPVMENRLRAAFGKDPELRIRALACRSSVCAVEAEGPRVSSQIWGPLMYDVFPEDNILAYEDPDNGRGTVGVSLLVFTRQR
jgi:hypothetical protein